MDGLRVVRLKDLASQAPPALDLSVVIPVYDEQDSIGPLHAEVDAALVAADIAFELIFVDDGSTDQSLAILRNLEASDSRVRVIALSRNSGQSVALAAGFAAVRAPITATLDADLQNDPADLPGMLDYLDRADVVNGVRMSRQDTWVRRLSSSIANRVRNAATGESVTDIGCSLRVMRTVILKRVELTPRMHRFLPTLMRLEGARIVEVPVSHRPRRHGVSKYGISNRLFVGLADLWSVARKARAAARNNPRRPS